MYLDIKQIKQKVNIMDIMEHYNLRLKQKSPNAFHGCCPLHKGDNKNAFHVDTNKNVFYCFSGCKNGGNSIDFVMLMENISFYKAALLIYKTFIEKTTPQKNSTSIVEARKYIRKRGINREIASMFGLDFSTSGTMKDRLVIPIHDMLGKFIAYCGRAIDPKDKPKYLFEKGFAKSNFIYNWHRVENTGIDKCFIVEGFFDVFHLTKLGYPAIALMGCKIYPQQIKTLYYMDLKYLLMLDGDLAGRKAMVETEQVFINKAVNFNSIYLPIGKQPENCALKYLQKVIKL